MKYKKQKGFSILAVILVIVAVIVAIGIWALSGQTNTSSSGNSTSDIQAATIINDSDAIKLSFDTLIINGNSVANITFIPNTSGATNMLDPVNGIQIPKPNGNAIKAGATATEGIWLYNPKNFQAYAGTTANDPSIIITGIKKSVCERINLNLHGSTYLPLSEGANSILFTSGATPTLPVSTFDTILNTWTPVEGWLSGCFSTIALGDDNVFFRVLKVN